MALLLLIYAHITGGIIHSYEISVAKRKDSLDFYVDILASAISTKILMKLFIT